MVTIKLSVYEKSYLLRILENEIKRIKKDYSNNLITKEMYELEMDKITKLTNRLNGHYKENITIQRWGI